MPRSVRSSLAASARLGAIVAGTALVTAAVVGAGAVAVQSVVQTGSVTADPAAQPDKNKPDKKNNGQGAAKRSDRANAVHDRKRAAAAAAAAVPFVCDPTKTHGQNVSAYVHSLPKGPGRGALVSQAAKSDCGKDVDRADEQATAERPEKAAKHDEPDKPEKTAPGVASEPGLTQPERAPAPGSVEPKSVEPKKSAGQELTPSTSAPPGATASESGTPDATSAPAPPDGTGRP